MALSDQIKVESVPEDPKPTGHTDDRVQQLLESARQVMGDFGVRRTTVGDVAKAAGVSRQTVYEYFPTKEHLIRETLKHGAGRLVTAGFDAAEAHGGTPEERLAILITVSLEFLRSSPLWSSKGKREDLVAHVTLEDGVYLGAGIAAIHAALESWWPSTDDTRLQRASDTLARTMVSHGLAPSSRPAPEIAEQLADLIANGLR